MPPQDRQEDRLIAVMRSYGADFVEMRRRFAGSLGIHSSDASALLEILYAEDKGVFLTPAALSVKLGLSRPATSSLLNRMERAGYVIRTREQSDRRVVTLRSGLASQQTALHYFAPIEKAVSDVIACYPPNMLADVERFVTALSSAMLESQPARGGP